MINTYDHSHSLLRKKIPDYIQKIIQQDTHCDSKFSQLSEEFLKEAENQIRKYLQAAKTEFNKNRKKLTQQLVTLRFFAQHTEQNHNLYPLFNQIDEKWIYNETLIEDIHLKISLPIPQSCDLDQEVLKNSIKIYQSYTSQLLSILKSQNVKKYCKKEFENVDKIEKNFAILFQKVRQSVYTPQVKLKKPFEEVLIEASICKHVQKMNLSLLTPKGIFTTGNYHQLLNVLQPNRKYLTELTLKIMDMQFSQQKCDILRKRLSNQFKYLKRVSIQNYYKQCKLGNFEDFNWSPYRKKVNVTAAIW